MNVAETHAILVCHFRKVLGPRLHKQLTLNGTVELAEAVQMNFYQSNTYRKDLSWLYFHDEPRVHRRQQVKDQESCISVFVAYLTILGNN